DGVLPRRKTKPRPFNHGTQYTLDNLRVLLNVGFARDNRRAQNRQLSLVELSEYWKSFGVQRPALNAVENRRIERAAGQRLGEHGLVTRCDNTDFVSVGI